MSHTIIHILFTVRSIIPVCASFKQVVFWSFGLGLGIGLGLGLGGWGAIFSSSWCLVFDEKKMTTQP